MGKLARAVVSWPDVLCDRRRRGEKRAQSLLFTTARPSSADEKLVLN